MSENSPKYRLSPQQLAEWKRSGARPHRLVVRMALRGRLDRRRLLDAFNRVVARHEALRTFFLLPHGGGAPAQAIHAHLPLHELPEAPLPESADTGSWPSRPVSLALRDTPQGCELQLNILAMCADVWSLQLLLGELSDGYLGGKAERDEAPMQYADLAGALNNMLQDSDGRRYWGGRSQPPAGRVGHGARNAFPPRSGRPAASVADFAPPHSSDPVSVQWALARWIPFLARMTGDRWVGLECRDAGLTGSTPGKPEPLVVIGPTVRALKLGFDIDASRPLVSLVRRIEEQVANDLDHAVLFDESLVALDQPDFRFEVAPADLAEFGGLAVSEFERSESGTPPDAPPPLLTLSVAVGQGPAQLRLSSKTLAAPDFANVESNLRRWLSFCSQKPLAPASAFEWQSEDLEQQQPAQSPREMVDVLGALRRWAAAAPDAIAVHGAGEALSYAELHAAVRAASHALASRGVQGGQVIGLQLERGPDWLVLWLACWRLKAVPLPLSVQEPAHRLDSMCRRAGASLVVTAQAHSSAGAGLTSLRTVHPASCRESHRNVPVDRSGHLAPGPHDPAYILFTSGSTGEPKATLVNHAALSAYLSWAKERYASAAKGGTLVHSELTFDFTQTCLWLPLLAGETVHIAAPNLTAEELHRWLASSSELSFVKLTPAHLQGFCAIEGEASPPVRWPANVVVGGAALTGRMLPPSLRRAGAMVHNEYGPTEATVGCSVHSQGADSVPELDMPIGTPCEGTGFFVLDASLNRVMPGQEGELFISGGQLAQGYVGNPVQTALSFLPHPWSDRPGARLYRTGDWVLRLRTHGYEYRGRVDKMIKRNGYRIEPNEITAHVLRHPQVHGAHTFALRPHPDSEPLVVCAVAGGISDAATLREWLAAALPSYMWPNRYLLVERLPSTAQGKVDESRLLAMLETHAPGASLEPGAQSDLAGIWRSVLCIQAVTPDSNFFAEGGDSIRAISVAVQARKLGYDLSAEDLFRHPLLHELAQQAAQRWLRPAPPAEREAQDGLEDGVQAAFPVSHLQLGMIYQSQTHGADGRYHDIFSYRLEVPWDELCLKEATRLLVRRHPALRTTFDLAAADGPQQIVWAEGAGILGIQDLTGLGEAAQRESIGQWIGQERVRGFDISKLPLLRMQVHRLDASLIQLTTSFHHAIIDGWSDQQIHTELFNDYRALMRDEPHHPAQAFPPNHYLNFVAAERAALASPASRDFWRTALAQAPVAWVVPLLPTPAGAAVEPPRHTPPRKLALPPYAQQQIKSMAREAGVPVSTLLLAAHFVALRMLTGQNDIVSCAVADCRLDEEAAARSVGLYINTLPLRARLGRGTWKGLVDEIVAIQRASYPYRRLPFAWIQREVGAKVLSQSLFYFTNFHNAIAPTMDLLQLSKSAHEVTSFPLTVSFNFEPDSGRIQGVLAFDAEQLPEWRVGQITQCYETTLGLLADGLEAPLPLRAHLPDDRYSVLASSAAGAPSAATLPSLFAEQARKSPDALAVRAADATLTYAELERWSAAVSSALLRSGARPNEPVGIMLPRSAATVAAVMGVLRAGACFVMVETQSPASRLHQVLSDIRHLIVATAETRPPPSDAAVVVMPGRGVDDGPGRAPDRNPASSDAAYRMYTSGSTGVAKCVTVGHGSLANVLCHFRDLLKVDAADTVLLTSALTFDVSILELALALVSGAALTVLDRYEGTGTAALAEAARPGGGRVVIQATPSSWAILRSQDWRGGPHVVALCGGEDLPSHLCAWLCTVSGEAWNVYGPTETTIWSAAKRLSPGDGTLGRPIANTRCYVYGDNLEPTLRGSVGDLYVAGAGLAHGYANTASGTAAHFLPDPRSLAGERMYRTGDRALVNSNGDLVFLGRADKQIKLAGHRLELGEVESALLSHPSISNAVVIAHPDLEGSLVAYVVGTGSAAEKPSLIDLRTFLADALPAFAIPARFSWITEIPRTAHGKLDLARLPASSPGRLDLSRHYVEAGSAIERLLQRLWSRVLLVQPIGVEDDFLELGGYSLSAISIAGQLRKLLGVELSAASLFVAPTIAQLANHLLCAHPFGRLEEKSELLLSML